MSIMLGRVLRNHVLKINAKRILKSFKKQLWERRDIETVMLSNWVISQDQSKKFKITHVGEIT
jgi:hypothetical protein